MIGYERIYEINRVRRRLKQDRYGGYFGTTDHTRDGDRLQEFTLGPAAVAQSQANLDTCLAIAREYEQDLVVIKPYVIQIAGSTGSGRSELVAGRLWPRQWLVEHSRWLDGSGPTAPSLDATEQGEVAAFYSYRACLCLNEHQGVYEASTGRRLTNRRDTIQRIWDLGFAAVRGRPLAIARTRWTGTRAELETITQLADRYWTRKHSSEAAKKMVSAYTSINRYAAWPGAW
jgi:hypothetical protein